MNPAPIPIWLRLGRSLLVIYAAMILVVIIAGTALFPAYTRAHAANYIPNNSWTAEHVQTALSQMGWPATVPAYVELARYLLMLGVGMPVGLLLLWRRPASWFSLYLAFVFISMSLGEAFFNPVLAYLPGIIGFGKFLGSSAWQFFFLMLYFFPNGQAVPGWTRWIAFGWLGLIAYSLVFGEIAVLNGTGIYFALPIGAILSQVYRYFWRSNRLERQQTKWVFAAVVLMLAFIALIASWGFNAPTGPDYRGSLVIALATLFLFSAMFALFPLAVAIAIFRYRLWDIDLVIRRTLQYGLLSFLIGLLYFGGVAVLQGIFTALAGQQSPLAVVLSTLLIAVLFNPLRRRLQAFIDRRFFRSQYSADHALALFSQTLRERIDLTSIESELVGVVAATIKPAQVSVWIREEKTK